MSVCAALDPCLGTRRSVIPRRRVAGLWMASLVVAPLVLAADGSGGGAPEQRDLTSLSLEELTQINITSFRNKAQRLSRVAGAVYVITREQIARSGLNSVPELLRLAPGVHVGQTNGSQWSVSARGTTGVYAARLLVLIDGRSIYSPAFSGVYWDIGMPPLEDIDRIEVIRGPGATIWGANAVLGVINIVTLSAEETRGTLVTAGGGNQERAFGYARLGGVAKNIHWRGYMRAEDHAALSLADGRGAGDAWSTEQAGFRMDGKGPGGSWMLQGSLAREPSELTHVAASPAQQGFVRTPMDAVNMAGNVTGEYRRPVRESGEFRLNFYYDQVGKQHAPQRTAHTRTWNADVRYDRDIGERHSVSVGSGIRQIDESIPGTAGIHFTPSSMSYTNFNAFAQDEIGILSDRLMLTFGAKLEHNPFTHWGVEPSASLLWQPHRHHSIWTSAARAQRTPSLVERAISSPILVVPASAQTGGLPMEVDITGSPLFGNEMVTDYQVGYRGDASRYLSVAVSLYRDTYQRFRSTTPGAPALRNLPVPSLVMNATIGNYMDGDARGAETTVTWHRFDWWKVEASHTYALPRSWAQATSPPGTAAVDVFDPPRNRWVLQSSWNPTRKLEADVTSYWAGKTVSNGYLGRVEAESYARLDIRLGYKLSPHWTLSVSGQNLLTPRHVEGVPESLTDYSWVKRGFYLKSVWHF